MSIILRSDGYIMSIILRSDGYIMSIILRSDGYEVVHVQAGHTGARC